MIESESALKWLIRVNEDSLCLRTGHQALDALLGNSLPLRGVSEIFAESGIGKIEVERAIHTLLSSGVCIAFLSLGPCVSVKVFQKIKLSFDTSFTAKYRCHSREQHV